MAEKRVLSETGFVGSCDGEFYKNNMLHISHNFAHKNLEFNLEIKILEEKPLTIILRKYCLYIIRV